GPGARDRVRQAAGRAAAARQRHAAGLPDGARPGAEQAGRLGDRKGVRKDGRRDGEGDRSMTTFVLLHGAYQGGWIFNPVAERLRAQGHLVFAPTLDGCAERKAQVRAGITTETHAEEIAALLFYEDLKDVVLVGTSSGGMVVCRVAELMRDRISRLVFVDALALFSGEKIRDIVTRSTAV